MAQDARDTESARTIIVRLPVETHKALRVRVAEEDTSIQQWVLTLIERELGLAEAANKGEAGAKPARK